MIRALAAAILICLSTSAAIGGDENNDYMALGWGIKSCGGYTSAVKSKQDVFFKSFAVGYLAAVNMTMPQTYNIMGTTDIDGVMGWLENYCKKNPTTMFGNALFSAVWFLYPTRTLHSPSSK